MFKSLLKTIVNKYLFILIDNYSKVTMTSFINNYALFFITFKHMY